MKKLSQIFLGIGMVSAIALQFGAGNVALAQTDQRTVTCGKDQVAVGVPINGQNCVNKGTTLENNVIFVWLTTLLKFLSVGVGVAAVGGVTYGGFLYLTARGNSSQTTKAVLTIINSLIGILLYALAFAIINFLVPGGVLK